LLAPNGQLAAQTLHYPLSIDRDHCLDPLGNIKHTQ
jgi:hypothetical protein